MAIWMFRIVTTEISFTMGGYTKYRDVLLPRDDRLYLVYTDG
jgi:hypothetical protein